MNLNIRIEISPNMACLSDRELIIRIDENGEVTGKNGNRNRSHSLFALMEDMIARLRGGNHPRTAEAYMSTLRSFRRFRNGKDMDMERFDGDTARAYEEYLRRNGLRLNTVSFYMRILRAVYNKAVEERLTEDRKPFRQVYTGIGRTRKRALPPQVIKTVAELRLSSRRAEFARDMFMFSFYTRGMSFVDMAWLRKSDLKNGALTYTRRKTGQRIRIRWEQCMQDIVDRHPAGRNGFLLPIIRESGGEREQYRRRQGEINHQLRNIARMAGADGGLTMYMARHSWASIAKAINIPLAVISDSMGHNSVRTTQIYLNSIDADVIDRANMAIISSVTAGEAKAQKTLTQAAGGQAANM